MTTIYFVRHAEPNYDNHDDLTRELTTKGLEDAKKVTGFLKDKGIQVAYSSPYKRAIDTIQDFTKAAGLKIHLEPLFPLLSITITRSLDMKIFCGLKM